MTPMDPEDFDPCTRAYPFRSGPYHEEYVYVATSNVTFTGQRGPIKDAGVNGCQIDTIIEFARKTLEVFNKKFPCRENSLAITKLQEAETLLRERTRDREERGVEGKNER